MAMSGVDYAKNLEKQRSHYNEKFRDVREAKQRDVRNLEENFNQKVDKRQKAYFDQKQKIEENVKANLERIDQNTQEALDEKSELYAERLRGERNEFDKLRMADQIRNDNQFRDLKSSFSKHKDSTEKLNNQLHSTKDERYSNQIEKQYKKHNKEINKLEENFDTNMKKYHQDNAATKRRLVDKNNASVEAVVRNSTADNRKVKRQYDNMLQNLRRANQVALDNEKFNSDITLDNRQKKHQFDVNQITSSFDGRLKDIERKGIDGEKKAEISKDADLRELRRYHLGREQDLKNELIKTRDQVATVDGSQGEFEKKMMEKRFEDRIGAYKRDLMDYKLNTNNESEIRGSLHRDALKAKDMKLNKQLQANDKEVYNFVRDHKKQFSEGRDRELNAYRESAWKNNQSHENEVRNLEFKHNKESANLLKKQSDQLGNMEEMYTRGMNDTLDDYRTGKKKYVEDQKKQRNEELMLNNLSHKEKLNREKDAFDHRMGVKTKELKDTEERKDSQFSYMKAKLMEEREVAIEESEDLQKANRRDFEQSFKAQATDFKQRVQRMEIANSQKTNKLIKEYNQKIDKLTSDHERELRTFRRETFLEKKSYQDQSQFAYNQLQKTSQMDREILVAQYEEKLAKAYESFERELQSAKSTLA